MEYTTMENIIKTMYIMDVICESNNVGTVYLSTGRICHPVPTQYIGIEFVKMTNFGAASHETFDSMTKIPYQCMYTLSTQSWFVLLGNDWS